MQKNKQSENRKTSFKNTSNIEIKPLYTQPQFDEKQYVDKLGFPGQYPFTRGAYANMYLGKLWTMRQYAGYGDAIETNKRFKFLLQKGQTGLSVAFDLPTQMGYDSDDPYGYGEVGKAGVAVSSIDDLRLLFDEIPLDKISVSMTINATASILLSLYILLAQEKGLKYETLSGTVQNDIIKEYISRGTYIFPPEESVRLTVDLIEFCIQNMPRWNFISVSGYHIREAGATASQEIGFTLANAICYLENCLKRNLDIEKTCSRFSFFFNAHNNFFEEIAKFRAARRLWSKILRYRFQLPEEKIPPMRFHVQTAGSTLTAQQAKNNIVRVALQALSAILGGAQSVHTNSYDEALSLPSEEAVKIALRTQQLLAFETGVADTIDPVGGSYYLENLTDQIEDLAIDIIKKIDDIGGSVKAIYNNFFQQEIEKSAYKTQIELESEKQIIVGVNEFIQDEKQKIKKFVESKDSSKEQIDRVVNYKKKRNLTNLNDSLKKLQDAASSDKNIMPYIIEALSNKATLGEVTETLKTVFNVFKQGKRKQWTKLHKD